MQYIIFRDAPHFSFKPIHRYGVLLVSLVFCMYMVRGGDSLTDLHLLQKMTFKERLVGCVKQRIQSDRRNKEENLWSVMRLLTKEWNGSHFRIAKGTTLRRWPWKCELPSPRLSRRLPGQSWKYRGDTRRQLNPLTAMRSLIHPCFVFLNIPEGLIFHTTCQQNSIASKDEILLPMSSYGGRILLAGSNYGSSSESTGVCL